MKNVFNSPVRLSVVPSVGLSVVPFVGLSVVPSVGLSVVPSVGLPVVIFSTWRSTTHLAVLFPSEARIVTLQIVFHGSELLL